MGLPPHQLTHNFHARAIYTRIRIWPRLHDDEVRGGVLSLNAAGLEQPSKEKRRHSSLEGVSKQRESRVLTLRLPRRRPKGRFRVARGVAKELLPLRGAGVSLLRHLRL